MQRHVLTYYLTDIEPYINWLYFYHAWQVKDSQEQFAEKVKDDIEEVKDNQKELTDKIDSIEQKPYKDWTKVKSTIITGVATAVGTGAIIYLINFLFNTNL